MTKSVAYSMLVDRDPDFAFQSLLLISSMVNRANIKAEDIYIHLTSGFDRHLIQCYQSIGVNIIYVQPFNEAFPHCNKIRQFEGDFQKNYGHVVFCDCDLLFLAELDLDFANIEFGAKIVDLPNPPIEFLADAFQKLSIPLPDGRMQTTLSPSNGAYVYGSANVHDKSFSTLPNNFNGGFYVVRSSLVNKIGNEWSRLAIQLNSQASFLGKYQLHTDQISMAGALSSLGIATTILDYRYNFPTHLPINFNSDIAADKLKVVHYHSATNAEGLPETLVEPDANSFPITSIARACLEALFNELTDANPTICLVLKERRSRWLHWNNVIANQEIKLPVHMEESTPLIAIETRGECNYTCSYCPVSSTPKRKGSLKLDDIHSLINSLVNWDGLFQLRFHFYNEPMLDKRLPKIIEYMRSKLPNTFCRLVTNGALLDSKTLPIYARSGVNEIAVSGHKAEDIERLSTLLANHADRHMVTLKPAYSNTNWSDRRSSIQLQSDHNRQIPAGVKSWGCSFLTLQIDYQGNVHQCCEDYNGDLILGNVLETPLAEIVDQNQPLLKRIFCGFFDDKCSHCSGFDQGEPELLALMKNQLAQ